MIQFTPRQLKQQLVLLSVGIACLYFIWPHWGFPLGGASLGVLGMVWQGFREVFMRRFFGLMQWIGKVQSVILLGIIYFVVLWPISLVYSWFWKPHQLPEGTQFRDRDHVYQAVDLEKMW
jgi:hypothetical protein